MTNFDELSTVIIKLRNMLKSIKDDCTYDLVNDFIHELESELDTQESNFLNYFKES